MSVVHLDEKYDGNKRGDIFGRGAIFGTTEARKTLPPRKSYRPSGHRTIQRLYSGRNLNRCRKRETRKQKTDLPRKVYPAIELSEYNPSLMPRRIR